MAEKNFRLQSDAFKKLLPIENKLAPIHINEC